MFDRNNIWKNISRFQSASTTQKYLCHQYEKKGFTSPETLSFENCYRFIYFLEHGQKYYIQAKASPIELQPVLLFYGMIQLLKACLLTVAPNYPENSQVLAHGVSTRKRKKVQYEFLHDEVKVQKHGLLTYFSESMFHVKQLEGEKFSMMQLLKLIPDLHQLFDWIHHKQPSYKVTITNDNQLVIPSKILDDYHLSLSGFVHYLSTNTDIHLADQDAIETNKTILIQLKKDIDPLQSMPLLFHFLSNDFYILKKREDNLPLPEVIIHYLLLYNLSMICRYETEWLGDLLQHYPTNDLPFIKEFLGVTAEKVPYLLFLYLNKDY